ncbi:MAG: MATE family efflux transporter [Clostridia bacterium]|nr:MATE family efflux transporter [Clostridia bacterium]
MAIAQKSNKIDMTEGPILSKMLRFALPLMLSSVLQLMFNAADIIVVGKFCGDTSLAAVSSNGSMVNLLVGLFVGLSIGANVLTARFFGAKNDRELSETVHTAIVISVLSGLLATIVGELLAPRLLILMKVPENVLPLSTLYLRIYFAGITSTLVYNFGSAILRAVGDTRRPLYFLMISGVVNVVLNLIFVTVIDLDVAGVALATAISQTLSAVLIIISLMREEGAIRLDPKKLRIHPGKLVQIIRIGLPAGLQGMLFSLSNVVVQSSVNLFGDTIMSGNGAAANIEGFGYMAMNAFYQATVSFTGQNFGKRRYGRIVRTQLVAQACTVTVGLIFGVILVLFGDLLLGFYTDSPDVVAAGLNRFNYIGIPYFICGAMDVLCGALRGIGYSFLPMIVSLLGACGLRLLWIGTVFQIPEYHVIETVYFAYPMSWAVTAAAHLVCLVLVLRHLKKKYPEEA